MSQPGAAAAALARTLLSLAAFALPSGCGEPGETPPIGGECDVILVTIDTLRADHMSVYGYERPTTPHIERWFRDAARFERVYSTDAHTSPSVVSILTGRFPFEHRLRMLYQLLPAGLQLLPDWLPERYQSAAFVSNPVLTDEAMGIAAHFDHYDDYVPEPVKGLWRRWERNAESTTSAALRWLAVDRQPERPLLLWVHYMDPHFPYAPPAHWERRFEHEGRVPLEEKHLPTLQKVPTAITDALDLVDGYDEEIAYVDREIGRLLDGYAARFPARRALIVLSADHGESMLDHEYWFIHGYHVYDEITRVPLLIRGPGIRPGPRPELASGVDIVPTILSFVGAPIPAGVSGRDLRKSQRDGSSRTIFSESVSEAGHWRAAIQTDRKWMAKTLPGGREVVEERLYDLSADPEELEPMRPQASDPTRERLLELMRSDPDPGSSPRRPRAGRHLRAPKVAPRATPEQLERLRILGYVE